MPFFNTVFKYEFVSENRRSSIRVTLTAVEYDPVIVVSGDQEEVLKDVETVINDVRPMLRAELLSELTLLRNIMRYVVCTVRFVKLVADGESDVETEMIIVGVHVPWMLSDVVEP